MSPGADIPDLPRPWGRHSLEGDETLALRLGARDLWIRSEAREIRLLTGPDPRPGEALPPPIKSVPEPGSEWSRWVPPEGSGEVELRPALPDRSLVLKPESPFRLLPRAEARVYVRVPLWIQVQLRVEGMESGLKLAEVPTLSMSDSWWGDTVEGELVYWLPTTARRKMFEDLHLLHLAACPLHLSNRSGIELEVDKLVLRVAHLSLFLHDGHFWADETRVTYHGDAEGSTIEMTGVSPEEAQGGVRVSAPREPIVRGFRARTFSRLRSLSGLGGTG